MEPKEKEKCDKRKNYLSSKLHMFCIFSEDVRHPVTKTFSVLEEGILI